MKLIYRTLISPLVFFLFHILALFNKKIREGLAMRYQYRLSGISPKWRDSNPIWIHCSSGEFEYAKPLIRELKKQSPRTHILVTYFSPTYREKIKADPLVDISLPLPFEFPGAMRAFIKFFKPLYVLVARTDLWPEFLFQCEELHIPVSLFSTTISDNKLKPGLRQLFFKTLLSRLHKVYTCEPEDETNLKKIMDHKGISTLGDTRYDQVLYRLSQEASLEPRYYKFIEGQKVFIAGSSWKEDENILIPALKSIITNNPIKLIVAPHEPYESSIVSLQEALDKAGLHHCLYSRITTDAQVLIVDRVGVLADLYKKSHFAFIGGSFKKSVHSVMEALAAGCICYVGPYYKNNREACNFLNQIITGEALKVLECVNSSSELESSFNEALFKWQPKTKEKVKALIQEKTGASYTLAKNVLQEISNL